MHTIELLDEAMALARSQGYHIRQDVFGGGPAGLCELRGQKWIMIDVSLSTGEQLAQVTQALSSLPREALRTTSPRLQQMLRPRKAA